MKSIAVLFLSIVWFQSSTADEKQPAPEYSRHDSVWRPGINEPATSLNNAFEAASKIQQERPGKHSWCLDGVRIPCALVKGGALYHSYEFRFSRLVRVEPRIQREECIVTVRMDSGKAMIGDIRPQK
jgi:hypothetical protein